MVDPNTGEVARYNPAGLTDDELLHFEPVTPEQIEQIIVALGDRLERAVPVLQELWQARYDAEAKLIEEHAKAVMSSTRSLAMEKKAEADIATISYRHEFNNAKAILHAAEQLQGALKAKLYGYLNINKAQAAAFQSYGRR